MKILKKSQSYIAITVLILMLVLVAITYLFAQVIYGDLAIARNNKSSTIAFALAEAGVQEAIYKVKYDTAARNTFLNTTNGTTEIPLKTALLNNGSYKVTIQNTDKGTATITATSYYSLGTKTAQRKIVTNIAQADTHSYPGDGAFYTHPGNDSNATGDIEIKDVTLNIYGGSLHSGRYTSFTNSALNVEKGIKTADISKIKNKSSTVNCNCLIEDPHDPELIPPPTLCSTNPSCTYTQATNFGMPEVDFDALKTTAQNANKYYSSQSSFYSLANFPMNTTKTLNGTFYIVGGLTLDGNRILNLNGIIATDGAIIIGTKSTSGTINLTASEGQQSGIASEGSFTLDTKGTLTGRGLIYSLFKAAIEGDTNSTTLNFTGGFLARRWNFNGPRTINVHFDLATIEEILEQPVNTTPVVQLNHWEEEY